MIVPCVLLQVFQFVFLTRLVISFFPVSSTSLVGRYRDLSVKVTDPVIAPVRRMMPPITGALRGFGFAELVVLLIISVVGQIVCSFAV